ncbi:MAG TPA: hypothetical protein VLG13_03495, partial [Patescibacteria group bacterium]|nr:hypothetical protein [Patescibacteria group bacterium]
PNTLLVKRAENYLGAIEALEKERAFGHSPNAMFASFLWRGVLYGYSAVQAHRFGSYVQAHPDSIESFEVEASATFNARHLAELICSHAVAEPAAGHESPL